MAVDGCGWLWVAAGKKSRSNNFVNQTVNGFTNGDGIGTKSGYKVWVQSLGLCH